MDEEVIMHGLKEVIEELGKLKDRVERLEKIAMGQKDCWMDSMDLRINDVEEVLNRITQDAMLAGRKPHKCPSCQGAGDGLDHSYCISCDGRGIVWG